MLVSQYNTSHMTADHPKLYYQLINGFAEAPKKLWDRSQKEKEEKEAKERTKNTRQIHQPIRPISK